MKQIDDLRTAIDNLDKVTIGFFRPNRGNQNNTYRILENDKGVLSCIILNNFNFHTLHISESQGKVIMFDGKTLDVVMRNITKYLAMLKEFNKL
jgi:hypothetical protein